MAKGILGRKLGMTQVFDADGVVTAVTVIQVGPCTVVRKKSAHGKDGYSALVLGFEDVRSAEVEGETVHKAKKPHLGVFAKAEVAPKRTLREIRIKEGDLDGYSVGQELGADLFKAGDVVDVSGKSKGRGFTGVMKRHNMSGAKNSHGVHEFFRHGGSIGCSSTPGRVFKGKRMAGQHGNTRVTTQNLRVVEVVADDNLVLVRGPVPGPTGALVEVRDAAKRRR